MGIAICPRRQGRRSHGRHEADGGVPGEAQQGAPDCCRRPASKVSTHGDVTVVIGDEFIEERMTGSISSLLASSEKYKDKMVLVRARSGETELKFSSRLGDSFPKEVNLGLIMKEAAELVGGVGGGHSMAAGAKIPVAKRDEFTRAVLEKVAE